MCLLLLQFTCLSPRPPLWLRSTEAASRQKQGQSEVSEFAHGRLFRLLFGIVVFSLSHVGFGMSTGTRKRGPESANVFYRVPCGQTHDCSTASLSLSCCSSAQGRVLEAGVCIPSISSLDQLIVLGVGLAVFRLWVSAVLGVLLDWEARRRGSPGVVSGLYRKQQLAAAQQTSVEIRALFGLNILHKTCSLLACCAYSLLNKKSLVYHSGIGKTTHIVRFRTWETC